MATYLQPAMRNPEKKWMLGPFTKQDMPILGPNYDSEYDCPMLQRSVHWEARAVIGGCPAVRDGRIHLVYHAEDDSVGLRRRIEGTPGILRIGLAESQDGLHFVRHPRPYLYPGQDHMAVWEHPRGCEIPRMVEGPDGTYFLFYSAYDGKKSRLSVASSKDLKTWQKHGLALHDSEGNTLDHLWSKSGAVVTALRGGRLIAERLQGRYWMYWGERPMQLASSEDLIHWTVETLDGKPRAALSGRPDGPDRDVTEPGVAVLTEDGIVLVYNNFHFGFFHEVLASGLYQALFDPADPGRLLDRGDAPFLIADRDHEVYGCVNNVVFCTGLAWHNGVWRLYYNGGDWVLCEAHTQGLTC